LAALRDEDVGRLDVAMDDAFRVRRIKPIRNLRRDIHQRLGIHRPSRDAMFERLAFEHFHGEIRPPFVLADLINSADIGMIQRGRRASLPLEAFESLRVGGKSVGQKFERDAAAEIEIFGFINDAHAASTEFREDAVVGNCAAD
jgi:hypothetical protein